MRQIKQHPEDDQLFGLSSRIEKDQGQNYQQGGDGKYDICLPQGLQCLLNLAFIQRIRVARRRFQGLVDLPSI